MKYKEGYAYHIKDEYFKLVQDSNLMQNKEGGNYRPTFFCIRDEKTSLLWMVPLSSRIEKYSEIHNKQLERYGNCLTICLGDYDGKPSAFLLQNMFPITDRYIDHVHTKNGNPIPVKYSIAQEVKHKMEQLKQLVARGKKIVFPDITRLQKLMLEELEIDRQTALKQINLQPGAQPTPRPRSMTENLAEARRICAERNAAAPDAPPRDKGKDR
ncbi:MAG: hypothetical protein RSD07_06675 [Angelakisella sp.]